jgi:hypothetical protein
MGMGHITPAINKVPRRGYMSHSHVKLYLLQGLYVSCPVRTLFIAGVICPIPLWNFIYCRGYMSHSHVKLYLLQGLYVPCPVRKIKF